MIKSKIAILLIVTSAISANESCICLTFEYYPVDKDVHARTIYNLYKIQMEKIYVNEILGNLELNKKTDKNRFHENFIFDDKIILTDHNKIKYDRLLIPFFNSKTSEDIENFDFTDSIKGFIQNTEIEKFAFFGISQCNQYLKLEDEYLRRLLDAKSEYRYIKYDTRCYYNPDNKLNYIRLLSYSSEDGKTYLPAFVFYDNIEGIDEAIKIQEAKDADLVKTINQNHGGIQSQIQRQGPVDNNDALRRASTFTGNVNQNQELLDYLTRSAQGLVHGPFIRPGIIINNPPAKLTNLII